MKISSLTDDAIPWYSPWINVVAEGILQEKKKLAATSVPSDTLLIMADW